MAAVMSFSFVEVLCTETTTTILEKSGLLKFFRSQQFEPFLLKVLFCSRPKAQLTFWPHPDRSAEGNHSLPVEFTGQKFWKYWMTVQAPSHKLLAAALRDSSQHLPLSLQQFQDTIPMTWQGAEETHRGAGSSQRAKSSQKQGLTNHLEITT